MKKLMVAAMAALVLGLAGTFAYALQDGPSRQVDVNAFRQFQKETLPLRDEMMAKGLELRNEYAKEKPDQNKITKLRSEMTDLRTRIQASADKQGLQGYGYGPGSGRGRGYAQRGCGYGGGPGFGGGPRRGGCGNCPAL